MPYTFGKYMRDLRRERLHQSLRSFCQENGFDPGNMSRLERGKVHPPSSQERVDAIADALKLDQDSEERRHLRDLARIDRGELPDGILDDEEVLQHLPVLFRTLRGESVGEEELSELIRLIRET